MYVLYTISYGSYLYFRFQIDCFQDYVVQAQTVLMALDLGATAKCEPVFMSTPSSNVQPLALLLRQTINNPTTMQSTPTAKGRR